MRLITEQLDELEYLTEDKADGKGKHHFITGIFLQSAIKNKNGRFYPEEVMDNEVARYITERVAVNRAWGELGHPQGPQINLERASHLIVELKKDGTNYLGKARIASETPAGATALGLMECGGSLAVSSRGLGTLKPTKSGIMEVQGDFRLATAADIVSDPSAPQAFVKGIMENVEWFYNAAEDSYFAEQLQDTKKTMHRMSKSQLEENALRLFDGFLSSLKRR
ncbi:MAG: primosomal protein [Candidatus Paceibacteria bacterium]